jgi:hypothetical protein
MPKGRRALWAKKRYSIAAIVVSLQMAETSVMRAVMVRTIANAVRLSTSMETTTAKIVRKKFMGDSNGNDQS